MNPTCDTPRQNWHLQAALAGVGALALGWTFWPTLVDVARTWKSNPQYQHGFLVPLFALFLLYLRRDRLKDRPLQTSWWGVPVLTLGVAGLVAGGYLGVSWFERLALIPCLAGLFLTLGGWNAIRWSYPALLFSLFMIPLPYSISTALSGPLQALGTTCSTFALQTLGFPALAEGNVILLNEHRLGVVEACSGLRMLMVFIALATGMAMLIDRPLFDRLVLVVSAVPIALLSNVIRITATGVLYSVADPKVAEMFFHDLAGWLMMPLALILLWIEMWILSRLLVEVPMANQTRGTIRRDQQNTPAAPASTRPMASPRPRRQRWTGGKAGQASPAPNGPQAMEEGAVQPAL